MHDILPLSVFIIAKNEADRIPYTLKSLQGLAAEIFVIDSGSTDDTMQVAEALGAKVIYHRWEGYGQQKRYGETLCSHEWVLNLDADEEIDTQLADSIRKAFLEDGILAGTPRYSAYKVSRKLLFFHEKKPKNLGPSDYPIRFYHRQHASYKNSTVHDSVEVSEGKVGHLQGLVIHRCFRSLAHWVEKINFYSSMQAEDFSRKGRHPSRIRIIMEPPVAFCKAYILRRWALYGIDGFVASYLYAFGRMLRMAKAREAQLIQDSSKNG